MHTCLDCKVVPGECVVPQHKLVVADFHFWVRFQWSKHVQALRMKWWKLKEDVAKTFKEIACGWGWPLALEKWHQKSSE
jgi:hypothetical protein